MTMFAQAEAMLLGHRCFCCYDRLLSLSIYGMLGITNAIIRRWRMERVGTREYKKPCQTIRKAGFIVG